MEEAARQIRDAKKALAQVQELATRSESLERKRLDDAKLILVALRIAGYWMLSAQKQGQSNAHGADVLIMGTQPSGRSVFVILQISGACTVGSQTKRGGVEKKCFSDVRQAITYSSSLRHGRAASAVPMRSGLIHRDRSAAASRTRAGC